MLRDAVLRVARPAPENQLIGEHSRKYANGVPQVCFIGVIDPQNPRMETAQEVCDDILLASKYIPEERPGTPATAVFRPSALTSNPRTARPISPATSRSRNRLPH